MQLRQYDDRRKEPQADQLQSWAGGGAAGAVLVGKGNKAGNGEKMRLGPLMHQQGQAKAEPGIDVGTHLEMMQAQQLLPAAKANGTMQGSLPHQVAHCSSC